MVIIGKKNEVYLTIKAEPHVLYELRDRFKFEVSGSKFMPQFRKGGWDGFIYLFHVKSNATGEIYVGLLDQVITYLKDHNYEYEFEANKFYGLPFESNDEISLEGVKDYLSSISSITPYDYQIESVYLALKHNRKLIVSPTGSGKSLMIYSVARFHVEKDRKILIIVPTTSLVEQMVKDFSSYGWDAENHCHKIYGGAEIKTSKIITVSTWQSIYKLPKSFFEQFDVVIGDEAHQFKSKSLVGIMTKLHGTKYRYGFTGTLDGSQTHKWVLEGLFGPSYKVVNTSQLIEDGVLSAFSISILILKHVPHKFENYEEEIQYLISHEKRNNFIKNLALKLKGNTLILFSRVESHGQVLYDLINNNGKPLYYIHGGVETEDREKVRALAESTEGIIILASYGTFSTGVNIKNLHNIIFASPSKSRVRNLQSIGRALRKSNSKVKAKLYDISDDISLKGKRNYTLDHLGERIKIYNEEDFYYEIHRLDLK